MTGLLARVVANRCAVRGCERERTPDSIVCRADLNDLWGGRLDRQPDGSYVRRRVLPARDETGLIRGAA